MELELETKVSIVVRTDLPRLLCGTYVRYDL